MLFSDNSIGQFSKFVRLHPDETVCLDTYDGELLLGSLLVVANDLVVFSPEALVLYQDVDVLLPVHLDDGEVATRRAVGVPSEDTRHH